MKKVLILGRSGYISTCFQDYMKKFSGYTVEAVSIRGEKWKGIDFSQYSVVFNTVGLAHNDARKGTDAEFMALNVELPKQLALKAKAEGVKQFIHMSSMIVYGSAYQFGIGKKYTYATVPNPNNIYGKSKLLGEQELQKLVDADFKVALIRSPLVYGEKATDNFKKLAEYAKILPFFPYVKNERSMVYADNLCELVRLIIDNESSGLFYPQQERYICTSQIVKDIAKASHHYLLTTSLFTSTLRVLSKYFGIVNKVFGSEAFEMEMSNVFGGKYRVVSYEDSIDRIANKNGNN